MSDQGRDTLNVVDSAWIVALDTHLKPDAIHSLIDGINVHWPRSTVELRNDQWHRLLAQRCTREAMKIICSTFVNWARRYGVSSSLTTGPIPELQEEAPCAHQTPE